MILKGRGRPSLAALLLALAPAAVSGTTLEIAAPGRVLFETEVADGTEWCLRWNHSVTGGKVADCFVNHEGHMILDRSYLHDFAAGLGEVPGRGTLRSAEDRRGYWITGIDERIPQDTLVLRVGRPSTAHHVTLGERDIPLSDKAAGERVTLRLRD